MRKIVGWFLWFIFAVVCIGTLDIIRDEGIGYLADFFVAFTGGILATLAVMWAYGKIPSTKT